MATIADPRNTTGRLISAADVQGAAVYDKVGEKLGTIETVMIDKASGRIAYAVMSFGGFLGIGDRHHPLPWQTLRYDPDLGGYVVDLDRDRLEGAPAYDEATRTALEDEMFGRRVHDYYGVEPFWSAVI
ncbi:PRC-barrel domain-containing protein [Acidisphaera sp. L21]|uniref:PRC-barrel domain-containing protein n=1 Tax=Acidisphaera sp. L21 TaxID=1641851 RepID=UPI00131BF962|nr:PRC-barrel domain-containing protein [Acidisphaera sp. L21]